MEFIEVVYCCLVPLLLLITIFRMGYASRGLVRNLLAVSNLLLIVYSFLIFRQLLGVYQLGQTAKQQFHIDGPPIEGALLYFFIRQSLVVGIPFLFLSRRLRANRGLSLLMLVLLFWDHGFDTWNNFDMTVKILSYCSLFCATYAVLWLLHQLPDQTPAG